MTCVNGALHETFGAQDLASVKCTFQGETRVIRVRKDIHYNAFMLKVSEEFGVALVVDTYEDAEGEMITLGENGAIADLGTQLSFGAKHRPYALKIFLRQAGTKRMSSVMITPIFTGERRRSSECVPFPLAFFCVFFPLLYVLTIDQLHSKWVSL